MSEPCRLRYRTLAGFTGLGDEPREELLALPLHHIVGDDVLADGQSSWGVVGKGTAAG
jgi:hypothetical protein